MKRLTLPILCFLFFTLISLLLFSNQVSAQSPATMVPGGTSVPDIISVSPSTLAQGQSYILNLTTKNFSPRMQVSLGEGIEITRQTVTGDNSVNVNISVSPRAFLGRRNVTIHYGNSVYRTSSFITVVAPPPTSRQPSGQPPTAPQPKVTPTVTMQPSIFNASPNKLEQGRTYQLTVIGNNFTESMELNFGEGINIKDKFNMVNPSIGKITVEVSSKAQLGSRKIQFRINTSHPWIDTQASLLINSPPKKILTEIKPKFEGIGKVFSKGVIILEKPNPFLDGPDHVKIPQMPFLDDSTVFTWREQNPGLAEWFELRIVDKSGNIIIKKRIDSLEFLYNGMKVKVPSKFYRPDPAFLAELLSKIKGKAVDAQSLSPAAQQQSLIKSGHPSGQTSSSGASQKKESELDKLIKQADLLWEVAGYRTYSKTGEEKNNIERVSSQSKMSASTEIENKAKRDEALEIEVEISERWPLKTPMSPNGLDACPLDKNVPFALTNVSAGKAGTQVKMVNYPGDIFVLTGSVNLSKSPYSAQVNNIPGDKKGGCQLNVGEYEFKNLFVDWGDGTVETLNIPTNPDMCSLGFFQRGGSSLGESTLKLPSATDMANRVQHKYADTGVYKIRVYQLAKEDLQHINPSELAASVDGGGMNSYYLTLGFKRGSKSALNQVAERAFMLYCHEVVIDPYKDMAAYGPLNLKSIEIKFPEKGAVTQGQISTIQGRAVSQASKIVKQQDTTKGKVSVDKAKVQDLKVKLTGKDSEKDSSTTSTCDKSFQAQAVLKYYGTGKVRIKWTDVTLKKVIGEEVVSISSKPRTGDPTKWTEDNIIVDSKIFNSPLLNTDTVGVKRLLVEAEVIPDIKNPELAKTISKVIGNMKKEDSTIGNMTLNQVALNKMKVGFISPSKESSSNTPPVVYLEQKPQIQSLTMAKEPPLYVSDGEFYKVVEADSTKPCKFVFPVADGSYEIYLDQTKLSSQGGVYSGSGKLKAYLNNSASSAGEYAVAVDFNNWAVPDGINVKSGTKLTGKPLSDIINAQGITGNITLIEGIAGEKMDATLNLSLSNKNLHKPGTTGVHEWKGLKSRLYANGDWYKKDSLPENAIGWSGFLISSNDIAIDLSRNEGEGPGSFCGSGAKEWVGIHLGNAKLKPYVMNLASLTVPVNDWVIKDDGLCGQIKMDNVLKAQKLGEGTVSINWIDAKVKGGYVNAKYYLDINVPWLNVNLKGEATAIESQSANEGVIDFAGLKASPVTRNFGPISIYAEKFRFGLDQGGWRVIADTKFSFKAEGVAFNSKTISVPEMRFGMSGRAYFDENANPNKKIALGSMPAKLGKTNLEISSLNLNAPPGGDSKLNLAFDTKIRLSNSPAMPATDIKVTYNIKGANYSGSGPSVEPFTVKVAFPPAQPTVESNINPVYTGPSGGNAEGEGIKSYLVDAQSIDTLSVTDANPEVMEEGKLYALNSQPLLLAAADSSPHDRFSGSVDLGMFGGPALKAEFRLGYMGDDDYWLTRLTYDLGSTGVAIYPPYIYLYQISAGLGYNFDEYSLVQSSLNSATPKADGKTIYMAGMMVGSPNRVIWTLDGKFTVKLGEVARMDYKASIFSLANFTGFFKYAGGTFTGGLGGGMDLMGGLVKVDIPHHGGDNYAANLYFGKDKWYINAGSENDPINVFILVSDTKGYNTIGSDGYKIGGGLSVNLKTNPGPVYGKVTGSLKAGLDFKVPELKVSGTAKATLSADVCADFWVGEVCIGPSVNVNVNMGALPLYMNTEACFDFEVDEVCAGFSL